MGRVKHVHIGTGNFIKPTHSRVAKKYFLLPLHVLQRANKRKNTILQLTEFSAVKIFKFFFPLAEKPFWLYFFISCDLSLFVFYSVSKKTITMQLSYIVILTPLLSLSLPPSWHKIKTQRGSRELGSRWFSCFCWPIISWEYPVYFHRPVLPQLPPESQVSVWSGSDKSSSIKWEYVVRSEDMRMDHVGLPKPLTFLQTFRHKHLPPHSQLCSYTDAFFKVAHRQDISSTRISLITAVSDCADLKLLGNCVHFSYLCVSNLPWGRHTSVSAGLIICLWH